MLAALRTTALKSPTACRSPRKSTSPIARRAAWRQLPKTREPVSQERPDHRQIADVHRDTGLSHIPQHIDRVPDVREVEDFGEESRDDDEDTQAKDEDEDELLLPRHRDTEGERERDEEHEEVGGDVEGSLDEGVFLEGGALGTWRGH